MTKAPGAAAPVVRGGDAQPPFFVGGGYRVMPADETVRVVSPHAAKLGITRIADITGLDTIGLPVFTAHRPNARSLSVAQGKGLTPDAARASALMEALEHHHAETPDLPLRYATVAEIARSRPIVDLRALPRLAGSQIRVDRPTLWVEGMDLATRAAVFVPYELVHMNYALPLPPSLGCFQISSTGLASGNTRDEALIHALAEIIERDAVALWVRQPAKHPDSRIAPSSITDPIARSVLDRFAGAGVAVAIWDITTDIDVPAFFATIVDEDPRGWRRLYAASGSGCHLDRRVALLRALTEAAQSRLTLISGARDDRSRDHYRRLTDRVCTDRLHDDIRRGPAQRRFDDAPTSDVSDFAEAVQTLRRRLLAAGAGAPVVVDLSQDLPASAVRVIVPGLEGPSDAPGYAPGARAMTASAAA